MYYLTITYSTTANSLFQAREKIFNKFTAILSIEPVFIVDRKQ